MIGVVIPAHNEEGVIEACVRSVHMAGSHEVLSGEKVLVIVVADACSDRTEPLAAAVNAVVLSVNKRNVGASRSFGADLAIAYGVHWLAFTDADTVVPSDWLANQFACGTDAVCGVINVVDWTDHARFVRDEFYKTYQDIEGHRHIHGANLACSVVAYQRAGGFQPLTFDEDVALVDALISTNASIAWTNQVRVTTSSRLKHRAPWGFGATLRAAAEGPNTQASDANTADCGV